MNRYVGDFTPGKTIRLTFNTNQANGTPITLAGTPAVSVYKDGGTTESTAGVTLTVDFDARTGLHQVAIDTSADGAFYAAGSDFRAVITTGTVDSISVAGVVVGGFSLANRSALRPTTADRTLDVSATGESGMDFDNIKQATGATTLTNITVPLVTTTTTVTTLTNLPAAPTDWLSAAAVSAAAAVKIEDAVWAGAPASTPLTDISAQVWADAPASTPLANIAAAVVAHADFIALDDKADAILVDTGTDIPATLTVIDDFLDTEMAAVKAKTDLIPDLAATGTVTGSGGTTTTLVGDSGLSASDDFYNGAVLAFTSGALKGTGGRRITDYAGSSKTFTFAQAFPAAPADGATFVILGRIDPAS